MANFSTHLYGGALVASAASLTCFALGWVDAGQAQMLFFLGTAGGLLPDIDSDYSTPVRGFFNLLGALLGFLVSFALVDRVSLLELLGLWLGVFLLVRFGVFELFARFTVHRGVWHSGLAVAFAGLAAVNLGRHWLGLTSWEAWLCAGFVALGYLTHLCLDELYSVDLLNTRIKRSFGSALKPLSPGAPLASGLMLALCLVLAYSAPPLEPALQRLAGAGGELRVELLPDLAWVQGWLD